ncbi:uncharacterized protein [Garra rufa]|uniref:uncharacterized protein n=1 Tax=Garra rufa TaxID=137080 RepID=UPI003CCE80AB
MWCAEFKHKFTSVLSQSTSAPGFTVNKNTPVASRLNAEGAGRQKHDNIKEPRDNSVSEPHRSWPFFSLSTRWRQRSIYGIGSSEPSGSSSGGMERVFSAPVGPYDCNQGLQASVRCKTPSFQRGYSVCSKRGFSSGVRSGNILPSREKSYKTSSSGGNSEGLLLPLFSNSKERRGTAPDTGSTCSKQALKGVQIQDAHSRGSHSFNPPGRLVCHGRSQGCVLSYKHLSGAQEISQVFLSERSVRICYSPVRAQPRSTGVQQMHRSSIISSETQGSQNICLFGRLSDLRSFEGARGARHRDAHVSSHESGVQDQLCQKPADPVPGDRVSRLANRLGGISRYALEKEDNGVLSVPSPVSRGKPGLVQDLSPPYGHDGFVSVCGSAGLAENEELPALGCSEASVPTPAPRTQSENYHGVRDGTSSVEKPLCIPDRNLDGERVSEKSSDYGRIPNGMGSCFSGQIGKRSLDASISQTSHKHAGVNGSLSSTKTFSSILGGFSCSSQDRQHNSGGIYQSPRGNAFVATAQSSAQADCLERSAFQFAARNARPGSPECGSGPPVEGQPVIWRMGTPLAGGESDLGNIRQGCRRSIRLASKRKMSAVFLSQRRKCTLGCGCAGTPVAERVAIRVPTTESNFSHPRQNKRKRIISPSDSPSLAREAVAGRDCPTPLGRALATPVASGPAVPSGGANFSPPSGTDESLGLAREGLNLNALGLPQEVINTIQSARAPSTRSLYDLKWRVFDDWCTRKGVIPFQCAVSEVLCFLQSLLNNGRAFSTIKVYLAAISACHVGFEGVSVGRHPLIGRFMKGVRRLRPVSKRLVPSWDLSMVLNALTQTPFEPLESVHIKFLSLKTVLLLALASAKRVGELHALSVHQTCLKFSPDDSKVTLLPNPAFVPKVSDSAYNCSALELRAFYPPPFSSEEERKLHTLCPVRALRFYVNRTQSFRKNDQLLVSWATHCKGKPISSQRLSHWMVEAIELAYTSMGLQAPEGLHAHSTRGISTSWALFKGISVGDICAAASWASPHTFIRFYRLDVTAPSLAHAVLRVGSLED